MVKLVMKRVLCHAFVLFPSPLTCSTYPFFGRVSRAVAVLISPSELVSYIEIPSCSHRTFDTTILFYDIIYFNIRLQTSTRLRQLLGKQMSRKPLYYKGFRDKNGILIVLLAFWLDFQNFRRQIHAHFLEYLFLFGGWCRCPIKISIICGEMTNVKPLDFTTY